MKPDTTSPDATTADLPLETRAALGSGRDFWTTKDVAGVPSITLTDGPHGIRLQTGATDHLGLAGSLPATCFPPAAGLSQSWDPELVERVGAALAEEAQAADVQVLLGPGINIKRSPLGGRNFEYYSEDPHLAGTLGAAWVSGLQGGGVGASLKHFALNNQEDDRMRVSADVDPRPLRELYLRAFRRVVEDAQPATVMCSYNAVNGVPVRHNRHLLTDILRGEWGFRGAVVSDWGAVGGRVEAVRAGLDLQMPSDGGGSDAEVVAAVRSGELDETAVTTAADRVAALARNARAARREGASFGDDVQQAHHELAREAAARSIVLLKNDPADGRHILPIADSGVTGSVAVIGPFAETPRYQGGGSSHVNATEVDSPLEQLRERLGAPVTYAAGFTTDGSGRNAALLAEAVEDAANADIAVVFLGLAENQESEGFDRTTIELPAEQLSLLRAVRAVQERVVVVLSHGGALELGQVKRSAPAILDGNLLGQGGGAALADVLTGVVNPSGKLSETMPARLADNPAYLDFPGEHGHVRYGEGLFVGYRWYDARELGVAFPFGHGLSYTTFAYSEAFAQPDDDGDGITVSLTVTNTGKRAGREVVQAYVAVPDSAQVRVPRALAGFGSVTLEPGESSDLEIHLDRRDLEYWDIRADRFVLEPGRYVVHLGSSSRDLRAEVEVDLEGEEVAVPLTLQSSLGEAMAHPAVAQALGQAMAAFTGGDGDGDGAATGEALGVDMAKMMASIPLDRIVGFSNGAVSAEQLQQLLDAANHH
ncbi:glycoside hydrolase family 3 C-terminal domain-containing protein [Corynebacterium nuruki]|uniref:glycoside hydrolase family 3 C-terminal domain-containing protein n=1 Tax=Corynebacterium nuruki TaxID=1032851 RepID=UPI0002487B6B|nr:glycoside hydrolase family 3 C-terminal domain-containing protein [Corynebacterium nuruki]